MNLRRKGPENLVEDWLRELEAVGKSADTIRAYRSDVNLWLRSDVDPRTYVLNLSAGGAKPATVNRRRAGIRAYHAWLLERRVIGSNPLDSSKAVKNPSRLTRTLTVPEVARLIDSAGQLGKRGDRPEAVVAHLGHMPIEAYRARLAAMIALEVTAGLRVSEVCNVRTDQVDLEKRTLRVIRKGNKEQQLRFGMSAKRAIEAWINAWGEAVRFELPFPYLFCGANGNAVTPKSYTRQLHEACWWAGIDPIHPHTLRHTFATLAIESGIPVADVQQMLGHEQIATTMIYVNRHPDRGFDRYEAAHPLSGELESGAVEG